MNYMCYIAFVGISVGKYYPNRIKRHARKCCFKIDAKSFDRSFYQADISRSFGPSSFPAPDAFVTLSV